MSILRLIITISTVFWLVNCFDSSKRNNENNILSNNNHRRLDNLNFESQLRTFVASDVIHNNKKNKNKKDKIRNSCNDKLIDPNSEEGLYLLENNLASESDYAYSVPLYYEASNNGALCLDGSVPRYYFRAGNKTNKYFIYFAGGAWCSALTKHIACGWDSCQDRAMTSFGSTIVDPTNDAPYLLLPTSSRQYFSSNKEINPLMYDWNIIYVMYCDGSSFSSNMNKPIKTINDINENYLYYRGHRILNAVINNVLINKNMSNATDIVIGGCSSGALSVYLHIDYMLFVIYIIKTT